MLRASRRLVNQDQDRILGMIIFNKTFFLIPLLVLLQSCASSNVSREAAGNVDVGYQNTVATAENIPNGSIADSYQNSSQMTKGLLFGGVAGAAVGGLTTGIGVVPGLATGAIIGGAYGAYIDANTTFADQLENRGVQMIVLGDQVLIVIQSNRLFNDNTAEIRPGAYSTLNAVAKYINSFPSESVQIAAYTNATGPERVNLALSKEQADSIERYLWQEGLNTRMVTAVGRGGSREVSPASSDWDTGDNYRIEITLERLPT